MNSTTWTYAAIAGAVCVSAGASGAANLIWSVTNPALAIHNWRIGEKAQAKMFSIFAVLAIAGVIRELIV